VATRSDPFVRAQRWLEAHKLDSACSYLDLGAGFGAHTRPLAFADKQVTAVDFDSILMGELRSQLGSRGDSATLHQAEILEFLHSAEGQSWDVILCTGDTMTHLPDAQAVRSLLSLAAQRLARGGLIAIEYRDSTNFSASGSSRFIEVARDSSRIMHCLLEPVDPEHLRVTDIVTEVAPEGLKTSISNYHKLRIAPSELETWAENLGLRLEGKETRRGMTTLIFRS
jgi:SAM-dependent methyltransferase